MTRSTRMSSRTSRATRMLAVALGVALAGCSITIDEPISDAPAELPAPAEQPPDTLGPLPGADGGADPLRVLLAVVILVAGDVDAAVAEGVVTPAELDLASRALDEGGVDAWVERASLLIGGG